MKTCSICQRDFTEYGNNAWPVNEGTCCNECDWLVVIPARLHRRPGSLGSYEDFLKVQAAVNAAFEKERTKP